MTAPLRSGDPIVVDVALAGRAYDIVIGRGMLAGLGGRVAALRPGARAAIVTDEVVARHHLAAAEASFAQAGVATSRLIVTPGEASKSYPVFERVCEDLVAARVERGDLVVALGGGVVGDLAGFAASVIRRGVDYVQVPTTLLSQVDSSVGGKTGINSRHGKNLVGAFHQPILVIADTALLDTLPVRIMRAGYAEVAKYGLIGDADFFAWLEANWRDVFAGTAAREHAIRNASVNRPGAGLRRLSPTEHQVGFATTHRTRHEGQVGRIERCVGIAEGNDGRLGGGESRRTRGAEPAAAFGDDNRTQLSRDSS